MSQPRIYLDHAATTPILPAAKAAMMEAMERWANPSSPHAEGRAARAALEDARGRIKRALGWGGELIFTSGASEAIDIAMKRTKRSRRLVSPVEHDAVFRAAPDAELLPLTNYFMNPEALTDALKGPPALVAIQHTNSETGAVLLTGGTHVHDMVAEAGGVLLCDCSQATFARNTDLGWPPMKFLPAADMYVLSAHKLGGPVGIGALLVRDLGILEAVGGQERGYRIGTENLPGAAGFAAAVEAAVEEPWIDPMTEALLDFKNWLWDVQELADLENNAMDGLVSWRGHIRSLAMPHLSARAQLIRFDQMGFAVSAGSACSSGSLKPSRVLRAFGIPDEMAERTLRVSFGWTTTVEDIRAFQEAWMQMADEATARAT